MNCFKIEYYHRIRVESSHTFPINISLYFYMFRCWEELCSLRSRCYWFDAFPLWLRIGHALSQQRVHEEWKGYHPISWTTSKKPWKSLRHEQDGYEKDLSFL